MYEATKTPNDEYHYDDDDKRKDRNHLWVLHGLYFISIFLALLSLMFVQKFNTDLAYKYQCDHASKVLS